MDAMINIDPEIFDRLAIVLDDEQIPYELVTRSDGNYVIAVAPTLVSRVRRITFKV